MKSNSELKENQGISNTGPLILIAVGLFWLLSNIGVIPQGAAARLWRLWPLALIFAGLSIVVKQASPRVQKGVSILFGLCLLVAILGMVLMGTVSHDVRITDQGQTTVAEALPIDFEGAESILMEIDLSGEDSEIGIVENGNAFLSYDGNFRYESAQKENQLQVNLEADGGKGWWLGAPPHDEDIGRVSLSSVTPLDLRIDAGSGDVFLDLAGGHLTYLEYDGSSGDLVAFLPNGDYSADFDMSSGNTDLVLPSLGQGDYRFDLSSGNTKLTLPAKMEARVKLDQSSGVFTFDKRFSFVSGSGHDEIWQTAGYDESSNRLDIEIDQSSGSLQISSPIGR